MVLRCKTIHKLGHTFSFSYLGSKFNLHPHTETLSMLSISYTEKVNQILVNLLGNGIKMSDSSQTRANIFISFPLNLSKTLCCWYVKHMFLFFAFCNVLLLQLYSFHLSWLFHVVHHFSINLLSSFFIQFSEIFSNLQLKIKVQKVLK